MTWTNRNANEIVMLKIVKELKLQARVRKSSLSDDIVQKDYGHNE